MRFLIVSEQKKRAIDGVNHSGQDDRQLYCVPLTDGRYVLPENLLTDMHDDDGIWRAYRSVLSTLPVEEVDEGLFPTVEP